MTTRQIGEFARHDGVPRLMRFVLVNERIPRENSSCALCCGRIERGYVRDPRTRLLYCATECYGEHERMSLPAPVRQTRRVS